MSFFTSLWHFNALTWCPDLIDHFSLELYERNLIAGKIAGIAFFRNNNRWTIDHRYNKLGLTRTGVKRTVNALLDAGLIDHWTGRELEDPLRRANSKMRAKKPLIDFLVDRGVSPDSIERATDEEVIRISVSTKVGGVKRSKYIDYVEKTFIEAMRVEVRNYRAFIAKHKIEHPSRPVHIRAANTNLYRTFNVDDSFKYGGRLYAPWWQNLSERKRKNICIDGHPTVELDYTNYQPRLIYALEGIDYTEDAYRLTGYRTAMDREILKKLVFNMLNNEDANSARLATQGWINLDAKRQLFAYWKLNKSRLNITKVIGLMEDKHSAIKHRLYDNVGREIMKLDSDICMAIIKESILNNVPIITIHDSFIVRRTDEAFLKKVMKQKFEEMTGITVRRISTLIH